MDGAEPGVAVLGVGHALPETVRRNDDPIFDWLREHCPDKDPLFQGYDERRVLAPGEDVVDLAVAAAERALTDAGVEPREVDLLTGTVSLGEFLLPSALARVHRRLGLPSGALILPLANDFNNFTSGLWLSRALIAQGSARRALLVCAGDWTRRVDYHTRQSISAGDGAGAAVVGPSRDPARFAVRDAETVVESRAYGSMFMQGAPVTQGEDCDTVPQHCTFTRPFFQITKEGQKYFKEFGLDAPPRAALQLLDRHGLAGGDVALISHQASSVLMDAWAEEIGPAQYVSTLKRFANMTVATLSVNLAYAHREIEPDHLVLLGIGTEMQTQALLLSRSR